MASTPKPVRKESKKFASEYTKSVKEHPDVPEGMKKKGHLKVIRKFNEKSHKEVRKKLTKEDFHKAHEHMKKHAK